MKCKTKKKPQDATMRNVKAANKRIENLHKRISNLEDGLIQLTLTVVKLHRSLIDGQ